MNSNRIASLEWGRILAIFAVMVIHTRPFLASPFEPPLPLSESWFGLLLNQVSRFAVPLFFLIAGYLIEPKLSAQPGATLRRYALPLLRIWLVWSCIYLLAPINLLRLAEGGYLGERQAFWQGLLQNPLNSLFEGGFVHLWFLPALICAVALIALFQARGLQRWLLPTALLIYGFGLLAGSYQPASGWSAPIVTRNGPFFSTLMVTLGFLFRRHQFRLSNAKAWTWLAAGLFLHLAEAGWLLRYDQTLDVHDFLLGTPIMAIGLFQLLLNHPNLGQGHWSLGVSRHVLGLYVAHMLVFIYLMLPLYLLGVSDTVRSVLIVPLCFVVTLLLVIAIEKTPLRRLLLR